MSEQHARSDRVLDAGFVTALGDRSAEELRAMHADCLELETEVSYVRRLAQARIDILEAEIGRRERGDSLEDLINSLPEILADSGPRGDPASSRLPMQMAPAQDSEWAPQLDAFDRTLTNLTTLSAEALTDAIVGLRSLEREVSDQRRSLFSVIDRIDHELAERLQTEARDTD